VTRHQAQTDEDRTGQVQQYARYGEKSRHRLWMWNLAPGIIGMLGTGLDLELIMPRIAYCEKLRRRPCPAAC
jgi:fatty acid desaturase